MTNHIHLLLHVRPKKELNDDELVDRVAALYGHVKAEKLRVDWAEWRRIGGEAALQRVEEERNALLRRMGDLSTYMKELKQWISRDYKTVFRRALAIGSQSFILETYARFPRVFNARKRPSQPFVTDIGESNDAICASHKPRKAAVS